MQLMCKFVGISVKSYTLASVNGLHKKKTVAYKIKYRM